MWDKSFEPTGREYIIYVPKDTATVRFTATHNGILKAGTATMYSGREKAISLYDDETDITLTYSCDGYTDSVYTVKIIKFEGTKTVVSEDGKGFNIKPINLKAGNEIILALYNNGNLIEMQSERYTGEDISFTTGKVYTDAKVMAWGDFIDMTPACKSEDI